MTVATPNTDWRAALDAARFDEAHRLYLLADDDSPDVRRALAALEDVQEFVRQKAWGRVRRRLERLDDRPPLLDWDLLEEEIDRLERSSRSLERVETVAALAELAHEFRWFPAEAANQRGTARIHDGEIDEAKREFGTAIDLDPRHYRAHTNLGNACLEDGDLEEAVACYRRALEINEEFANAHHNLGVAFRRQGDIGRSVRQLRRAQRLQQRSDRERGRERLTETGGASGAKLLRWLLYAALAAAAYVLLRGRGLF